MFTKFKQFKKLLRLKIDLYLIVCFIGMLSMIGCTNQAYVPGEYLEVSYPPSTEKGELQIGVTFTLWVPGGVEKIRGVIVHQHGAGTTASKEGSTAAYDLHWQALARKWDCALLGPAYHVSNEAIDLTSGGSELWFDPRLGSEKTFLTALREFSVKSGHPEISVVPWVLWGHSGGGIWADVMACLHPDRVIAMWLRSGSAAMFRTKPEFIQPKIPEAVYEIPFMCNPGVKEKNNLPGIGTLATFKEYRAKGAPVGFAEDPRTGHECGDSRYLAIPYLDACLAIRLPDKNSNDQKLKFVNKKDGWLASLTTDKIMPAKEFGEEVSQAVWLPNEVLANAWEEYISSGVVNDLTPPPAPLDVKILVDENKDIDIKWNSEADFESGIRCFIVLRDGKKLAQVPENPVGKFGRPLFQSMTYHDTPDQPVPEMHFVDKSSNAKESHSYSIVTVNSVGLKSKPSIGKIITKDDPKPVFSQKSAFFLPEAKGDMVLWYKQPGVEWLEGMPIGNGYMGGMVFGGIQKERIALNESSFWSGRPHDYNDPKAINYFPKIRDLVSDGKYQEAEKMVDEHFYGKPIAQQAYQPLGDLMLSFDGISQVEDYRRDLDMETGIATVSYRVADVVYTREIFLSYPDRVMVVRVKADKPGNISVQAGLQSPYQDSIISQPGQIMMDGCWKGPMAENWLIANIEGEGIRFRTVLKAIPEGGKLDTKDGKLNIKGANAVTFILTAGTSYINYSNIGGNPAVICQNIFEGVKDKNYEILLRRHIKDFNGLIGRVHLDVGDQSKNEIPTDERILAMKAGSKDANLEALCFQFGRYILASSSRAGGQPANLQGIWNESVVPNWGSKYTININTQMNYWPAEVCNLSECHQPLFDMIQDISVTGAKTAQMYYGCEGWVAHHNIDLWRGTAPVDAARYGMWPVGGAWLCQHLWEHYAYTEDLDFLKKYYPVMKGSAKFLLDLMVEHPTHKWLVTPFSMSPEHGFLDNNGNLAFLSPSPTMDVAIIRELFPHCIKAGKLLGVDAGFGEKLEDALTKLPPYQIGESGFLQEWLEDWKPGNQGHNFSTNFPFFPGNSIQLNRDKELSAAIERWMESRKSRGGFPVAWNISMWSRLERSEKVAECITQYVVNSVAANLHNRGSNQSDGSFGFTAGVAESLVQSHAGEINLLPALASGWNAGSVSGLKARGGYEICIEWEKNQLQTARISNKKGGTCKVHHNDETVELVLKPGEIIMLDPELKIL